MNDTEKPERLVFPKTIVYHPKVKTGNWYEDQQRYKRDNLRHNTEYYHEYQEKPLTTVPDSVKWDLLFKSEGTTNVCPPRLSDASPNFHDNFASSYELSYSYFPKIAAPIIENVPPKPRKFGKYRPVLELIESYGNINNYGLGDIIKKHIQYEENAKRRSTSLAMTDADYREPGKDHYVFCRWPRYRAIKKKTADIYPRRPPNHPRLSDYNPITWEPIDREKLTRAPKIELDC
ncbi:unnamed protein product [Psylliodes chrysocephalus]|uniref:Uncharacterized protein n=1 Tax=Psylliodes chrysocephalus TaxID=3402493 RepID=A0A9P0GGP2_9CUCU|nr:unnamed protein product [Psylliodes chrysocephala]